MVPLFIADRDALADATLLLDDFGPRAGEEARARADRARASDNVLRFCHWRQIERLVGHLVDPDVVGTVH
ncbi:hypothetical protein [Sphingomicrobium astaxanthinifaciens]|uniref:hypothetical protein n=1 Tax=Sphingomicrobium astaxanthinifaciens TaxID=1227949 RepID=UPI001FCBFA86|nr:hypothetical protein [Sphingomicrobium astaxanthinifaciens]MCJ7420546.1 hypothetical protein [Sphingomicrobium astaxanthinifaciens]